MSNFSDRLHGVIPGGAHTYSRGDDQFPANAPSILERGEGAYVWDPAGRKFLDYGMGLRAVTLGYSYPAVSEAAIREIGKGVNLTRASTIELKAAEVFVDLFPSVDMVKFAKNGSNVTTAAVKIARAYTGRRYVCVPRQHPFFSFDDWFIGVTPLKRGIPPEHYTFTLLFDYGDIASLQRLFDEHPGDIAAVMMEPATNLLPCPSACNGPLAPERPCSACPHQEENFLHQVQKVCRQNSAVFILDEMITGFRWHLQGAQTYFGVGPDLSTFGKGMANGFSVSAVAGRRELMEVGSIRPQGMERMFLMSTTHGCEMPALGAFVETVKTYREHNVIGHLWRYGRKLFDGVTAIANAGGLGDRVHMDGSAIGMNLVTRDKNGQVSAEMRTLLLQELIRRGVLMPWVAVSLAHGDSELQQTLEAFEGALKVYGAALDGGIGRFLEGPIVKPVFRTYN